MKKHISASKVFLKRYYESNALDAFSKILRTEENKFHFYKNNRSLIDSRCIGRDEKEFENTDGYKHVTKEALSYNPDVALEQEKELPSKPSTGHTNWFKFYFGNFFTKVVKWIPLIIIVFVVLVFLPLILTGCAGQFTSEFNEVVKMKENASQEMLDAAAATPLLKLLAAVSFRTNTLSSPDFISLCFTLVLGFYALVGYVLLAFLLIFFTVVPLIYASIKSSSKKKFEAEKQKEYEEKLARVEKENEAIRQRRESNRQKEVDGLIESEYQFTNKYAHLFASNYQKLLDLRELKGLIEKKVFALSYAMESFQKTCCLHEDYLNDVVALSSFVDYFERGICDHFEGEHGAIERYADEVYRKQVIAHFDKLEQGLAALSDKLDTISHNQNTLAKMIAMVGESVEMGNYAICQRLDSLDYKAGELIKAVNEIEVIRQ